MICELAKVEILGISKNYNYRKVPKLQIFCFPGFLRSCKRLYKARVSHFSHPAAGPVSTETEASQEIDCQMHSVQRRQIC
jgi:hypothetical protein